MSTPPNPDSAPTKFRWYEQLWLALPLGLIAVGGAVGGVCGGIAWGINQKVFRKVESPLFRYVWTGLISGAAVLAYLVLAAVLLNLFRKSR